MKLFFTTGILAASLLATSSLVQAKPASAVLLGVTGKVLVNDGKGFQPAQSAIRIESGFDIFLADGATATLHFNDANCDVALMDAGVTHVSGADMCQQALLKQPASPGLRGAGDDIIITPANGALPLPAGAINPYFIASGIFAINALAFTQAALEKDSQPTSAP